MTGHYILNADLQPIKIDVWPNGLKGGIDERALIRWAEFIETFANRVVQQTHVGPYWVSTVFLGLDHQFGKGPPLIFETMVFDTEQRRVYKIGGKERETVGEEIEIWRYSTWPEAVTGHNKLVHYMGEVLHIASAEIEEMLSHKPEP